jgi:chitin disaccharide deacetylase
VNLARSGNLKHLSRIPPAFESDRYSSMGYAKRLIVNADGFGFGPGATQGVIDAISNGQFISSVSVNANFPEAERLSELLSAFPNISVGIHLNPMVGRPCLPPTHIRSLVGPDGFFTGTNFVRRFLMGKISQHEMEAEFDAQINRVKELAGSRLTHLDSHGNSHLYYFDLFLSLARKWGLQRMRSNASLICLESPQPQWSRLKVYLCKPHVRLVHFYRRQQMRKARAAGMRLADNLITVGYAGSGNKTKLENWLCILRNLPAGVNEIYCHPAYPDETLHRWASYCDDRARELAILQGHELCRAAREAGVEIVSFNAI